ncbi:MAG: 50S ribosomal protein L11 methyltransferase [Alphaproteobacteria bacterium]|nr:50S ribosomal protein L11 methyltransferase [Alphaproteobacteria bacterium]
MYNIKPSCKLIHFFPVEQMPEREAEFLEETFDVTTIDYTDDGLEKYTCYAKLDFDINAFKTQITNLNLSLPEFEEEILESKNWLKENVIKFPPYEIGAFLIYGIHEATCPKTDKLPVQVYAATAFGSEHATTQMCLSAITELKQIAPAPKKILDMGTGSGILSIAAAKIWHNTPKIIAADIDSESVDVTQNNAITNNVENNITVLLSNGYQNPAIPATAPYDMIFANILANPLKEMSPNAYASLIPNGYYLISGFIENQEQDIINTHFALGFKLIKTYKKENWRAALLQK